MNQINNALQNKPFRNNRTCLIIAGGEFALLPEGFTFDYCIACDRGYEYAERLGVKPDLIVGDFDSASQMPAGDVPVIKLPVMKDDTDTVSAVKEALKLGYRDLAICCAFGGRFDHSLANVQTAAFVKEQGGSCFVYGKNTGLTVIKNERLRLPERKDSYLSVFSLSEEASGVSLAGTKYDVENVTLSGSFPLGVSNEWAAEEAVITVKKGMLAVVICKKD